MTDRNLHFRADIEGLRAVAIVLVVLFHAGWERFAGGFLGVDVFFVLSGFLISGVLLDEVADSGTLSLTGFWARRARRLLPAAALVTVVVLFVNAFQLSPFEQITFADSAAAFATYASNILFAVRSTDYFGDIATRDPLLHTWSLSVEEQYYLFFAPLVLLLTHVTKGHGYAEFARRFRVAAVVLTLVSFVGCVLVVRRFPTVAFYALPTRAWEFGIGALAMLAQRRVARYPAMLREGIALGSLLAVCASAMLVRENAAALGLVTLAPTLGTAGLILTGAAARPTWVGSVLGTSPMRVIGRLSYSWYLWHWPMLVFLREISPQPSLRARLAVAMLSLIPASLAYVAVESPIRFSRSLQARARQVVGGAVALAVLTYGASALAVRHANGILATPAYARIAKARSQSRVEGDGCEVPLLGKTSPECRYGPGRNDTTIVVFGDSHAAHWFPGFDAVAALRGWTLIVLSKTSCPAPQVALNNLGRRYTECDAWRADAIRRIVARRPTVVVLASSRSYGVVVGDAIVHTDSSAVARREWGDGLRHTLIDLVPSGARLVVLEDTPQPGFNVPRCIAKFVAQPNPCVVPERKALNPLVSASERSAVLATHGSTMVSLNGVLCEGGVCPVLRDGMVRYRDSNHLTVAYAASLAPQLSELLTRVFTAPFAP